MSEGSKGDRGYQMTFPSVWDVEILGRIDFDYVWLDGEHGPFGYTRSWRRWCALLKLRERRP